LRGKLTMLEVACRRCERRGRLRIERLIAEHGSGVLDLRAIIAADCPHMRNLAASMYDRCGVRKSSRRRNGSLERMANDFRFFWSDTPSLGAHTLTPSAETVVNCVGGLATFQQSFRAMKSR
jgi:hypothetical protein